MSDKILLHYDSFMRLLGEHTSWPDLKIDRACRSPACTWSDLIDPRNESAEQSLRKILEDLEFSNVVVESSDDLISFATGEADHLRRFAPRPVVPERAFRVSVTASINAFCSFGGGLAHTHWLSYKRDEAQSC